MRTQFARQLLGKNGKVVFDVLGIVVYFCYLLSSFDCYFAWDGSQVFCDNNGLENNYEVIFKQNKKKSCMKKARSVLLQLVL